LSLLSLTVASVVSSGCQRLAEPPAAGVVAIVDGSQVTADDLRRTFWGGTDEVRRRSLQRGGRHYLLDYTIGDLLLERLTRTKALNPRFSDLFEHHERLMKQLLVSEFEPTVDPSQVPEEQVRAEYERVRPSLAIPETIRIELAYYRDRARAEQMAARLLAAQRIRDEQTIDQVMRVDADPWPEDTHLPQSGIFTLPEAARFYGDEVAQAAFGHNSANNIIHPFPIPIGDGWAVMVIPLYHAAEPAPPFEEVERQMRDQAFSAFRERALDQFVESFLEHHRVGVHYEYIGLINWTPELPETPAGLVGPSSDVPPLPISDRAPPPDGGATAGD
jgi:hypothetical protein